MTITTYDYIQLRSLPTIANYWQNGYTEYDRLVARRVLPRQVPVARHFNVVVPGVREAD